MKLYTKTFKTDICLGNNDFCPSNFEIVFSITVSDLIKDEIIPSKEVWFVINEVKNNHNNKILVNNEENLEYIVNINYKPTLENMAKYFLFLLSGRLREVMKDKGRYLKLRKTKLELIRLSNPNESIEIELKHR